MVGVLYLIRKLSVVNQESAEGWSAQPACDQAAACLSALTLAAFLMIVRQASFGGSPEVPKEITDTYCGPTASGEQSGTRNTAGLWGEGRTFCLIPLNYELWRLRWT